MKCETRARSAIGCICNTLQGTDMTYAKPSPEGADRATQQRLETTDRPQKWSASQGRRPDDHPGLGVLGL